MVSHEEFQEDSIRVVYEIAADRCRWRCGSPTRHSIRQLGDARVASALETFWRRRKRRRYAALASDWSPREFRDEARATAISPSSDFRHHFSASTSSLASGPCASNSRRACSNWPPLAYANRRPGGASPQLSTVSADRVVAVARVAGVDARRVLGYAVAHELGHLLNDPHHPDAGLMRALWSVAEIRRNRVEDFTFARDQAEMMRQDVAARTPANR